LHHIVLIILHRY